MSVADGISSPIALVITADDFGYCPARNRAISYLYAQGAISQASLIVNSRSSADAAQLAKRQQIPLGLHFNITEGQPVSSLCPGLCNQDGQFLGKMGLRHHHRAGLIAAVDVRAELQAQIDLFTQLLGRPPGHVDGHQHVHVLPGVCEVFADVLCENGIVWTRVPNEVDLNNVTGQRREFYDEVVRQSKFAAVIFAEKLLRFAPGFIGMSTMGRDMSLDRLLTVLNYHVTQPSDHVTQPSDHVTQTSDHVTQPSDHVTQPSDHVTQPSDHVTQPSDHVTQPSDHVTQPSDHVTQLSQPTDGVRLFEWMVHPGFPSKEEYQVFGAGPDDFALSSDRQYEFDTLSSAALTTLLAERDIRVCSYESIECPENYC